VKDPQEILDRIVDVVVKYKPPIKKKKGEKSVSPASRYRVVGLATTSSGK
jgi:hypothetical protein